MLKSLALTAIVAFAALGSAHAASSIDPAAGAYRAPVDVQNVAALPKAKTPPRNPFGPKPANAEKNDVAPIQLACQTGSLKNKCKPDIKLPGRPGGQA